MRYRSIQPELLDDPHIGEREHFSALRGLQRLNRWTRLIDLVWRPIRRLAQQNPDSALRILDVATGSADLPIQLKQRARRESVNLEIEACDISSQALQFALDHCRKNEASINLLQLNVLSDIIPRDYDVIMCSTFLHHLTDEQTEFALSKMIEAARLQVLVVDLVRSPLNWLQVAIASRMLSRSPVVHSDGPQSVRAAFTLREVEAIVSKLGFQDYQLTKHWPCRFMLVGNANA